MQSPLHYRNKAKSSFVSLRRRLLSGVYQSSTGCTVPVENCMIQGECANRIIAQTTRLAASFQIKVYNPEMKTGILRHILVRRGFATKEILVVIAVYEDWMPNERSFVDAVLGHCPEITALLINVSKDQRALVLGGESRIVHGSGKITDILCGKNLSFPPTPFIRSTPCRRSSSTRRRSPPSA